MQNTKPIFVQGHWRNRRPREQTSKLDANTTLGMVVVAALMVIFLAMFWQFTITVAAGTSLATFAHKYHKFLMNPSRLVVNRYDEGTVQNVWNNIKGMIQEG